MQQAPQRKLLERYAATVNVETHDTKPKKPTQRTPADLTYEARSPRLVSWHDARQDRNGEPVTPVISPSSGLRCGSRGDALV